MDQVHAERREPAEPPQPLELDTAGEELLRTAGEQSAGRAARTLTPGAGAPLSQTLIAIKDGRDLDEHVSPGPATIQVVRGELTVTWDGDHLQLAAGQWATLPLGLHKVHADTDAVALVTTAQGGG